MDSRPTSGRVGGFTLLEVMIVVGIAVLIMVISIPFVQRTFKRDAVYRAVKVVEDACHNARATAIFNNSATDLIIRPKDRSFQVQAGTPRASATEPDLRTEGVERDGRAAVRNFAKHAPKPFNESLEEDVVLELLDVNFTEYKDEEEARVRFHPNGTSDEFTIVMRIGTTSRRKITLDIVTGLPTMEALR